MVEKMFAELSNVKTDRTLLASLFVEVALAPPRFRTFSDSLYARARRRPSVTMFGFSRQGR